MDRERSIQLFDKYVQRLTIENIRHLCFFLGGDYDYESFTDVTGKDGKYREVVLMAERRDELDRLEQKLTLLVKGEQHSVEEWKASQPKDLYEEVKWPPEKKLEARVFESRRRGISLILSNKDYSRYYLQGLDLSGVIFHGAKFIQTDLREVNLRDSILRSADLAGAYLDQADLSDSDFTNTILSKARLVDATLSNTMLQEAELVEAKLVRADLTDAILTQANVFKADMESAILVRAVLKEANLREVNFRQADLSYADLTNADLRGAILDGSDLTQAILTGCQVSSIQLAAARTLEGVILPEHLTRAVEGLIVITFGQSLSDEIKERIQNETQLDIQRTVDIHDYFRIGSTDKFYDFLQSIDREVGDPHTILFYIHPINQTILALNDLYLEFFNRYGKLPSFLFPESPALR